MAVILDIAGKPLPPRKHAKNRLRAQDLRDLMKALIILMLIVIGYLMFVPSDAPTQAAQSAQSTSQPNSRAG